MLSRLSSLAALTLVLLHPPAAKGHGEGVLVQKQANHLVTGYDSDTPGGQTIGTRVFSSFLPSSGITSDPSFLSVSPAPVGAETLAVGSDVYWDFLPLTADGATANLLHWGGAGPVTLTPAASATLRLYDAAFGSASVDGAAAAVPGRLVGRTTSSSLALHAHRLWELAAGADPGVYVTSLRLRSAGLVPTPPIYVAFATFGTPVGALNDTVSWLNERLDTLTLRGDFDFDGVVGPADQTLWSQQLGATAPLPVNIGEADGNGDGLIDAADYTVWRDAASAPAVAAIPEPAGLSIVLLGVLAATLDRPRRGGCRVAHPAIP
jgi:hypothetical protein